MRGDESPFVAAFSPDEWVRFSGFAERQGLVAGQVVMRRGEPPGSVYVVESGNLEAVDPRSSPPTVLGAYRAGSVLGEMSFLDGAPVSADVRVGADAVVLRFDNAVLSQVLRENADLDRAFHHGTTITLLERTRSLTATTVAEVMGRRDSTDEVHRFSVGSSAGGHALKVRGMMSVGYDPHAAVASADQTYSKVTHPVRGDRVTVGSAEDCDIVLADARIAPQAAELVRVENGWRVVSSSSRAAVVDGRPVSSAPVDPGGVVQIGRYQLTVETDTVTVEPLANTFLLRAIGLGRTIGGKNLLDGVSFTAMSGEVIALIGPSGAGKTTLLDALRGNADRGEVHFDEAPFAEVLATMPSVLGEVPQDDIVLPELTVEESLLDCARLRLPGLSATERSSVVHRVIDELGLGAIRHSRIGDPERRGISGGQRKRVNIAQEILTPSTRILFLDEPTSGLDPRSAGDIARLARRLADQGRIVVMVTHDVSADVLSQVDHLLVLVPGGRLAWFGPVADGTKHFRAQHPGDIFNRLPDRTPEEWVALFESSPSRKMWVEKRETLFDQGHLRPGPAPEPSPVASRIRQLGVLVPQYAKVKIRDRASMAVLLVQPLLVAIIMPMVFQKATVGLIFLLVLACFWFGMSAAVRELIAQRVVWRRQRRLGLSSVAWVGSKAIVLGGAVGFQCLLVTLAAFAGSGLGPLGFGLVPLLAATTLTGFVGIGIGLFVSSLWRPSEAAVGTIVLLLIPQIAFSGVLMPLAEASPLARALSWTTPVRYALQLALHTGRELAYQGFKDGWYTRPNSGLLVLLGLRPKGEDLGLSPGALTAALLATAVGAIGVAMIREGRDRA